MQEEIDNLQDIEYMVDGKEIIVKSEIFQTMHDGKNRNAIYSTVLENFLEKGIVMKSHGDFDKIDFQTCWVCLQQPEHYNSLDNTLFKYDEEWVAAIIGFGCSPLHLKMGVTKELRTASVTKKIMREAEARQNSGRDPYTTKQIEKRKTFWKSKYQDGFIQDLNGLLVGFPDRRGGNTDRGNSADRILVNAKKTSKILSVKKRLVVLIRKLIVMLNSTHEMPNISEYQRLGQKAHTLYVKTFGDYRTMGAVTHFIFHHGHLYLAWARDKGFPLGALGECSVEDDNQFRRNMDTNHSRWTGTRQKLEDMMWGTCWR